MKITFERKTLYEEVWSTPKNKLTEKYNISYHQLTKACEELNIPTPPVGYWKKLQHGKNVNKIPLPEPDKEEYSIRIQEEINFDLANKLPKKPKHISVNKHLRKPHKLVKATYNTLKDSKVNYCNRVQALGSRYLDISVNPNSLKRAMRIFDAIVKELERQGFSIKTECQNRFSKSYIQIGQEKVYFQLREDGYREEKANHPPEEERRRNYHKYKYFTTGKLKLKIFGSKYGSWYRWIRDNKSKQLEDQLDNFFPYVFEIAEKMKKSRLDWEEKERRREKRRKIQKEAQRQRMVEKEHFKMLEERSHAFTKSQYIYDFIAKIEEQRHQLDLTEEEKLKIEGWIHWATMHANRLNPIKQTLKSILEYQ